MKEQFKVLQQFLAESKIDGDLSFFNINFWNQTNRIDIMGYYQKELAFLLMPYAQGVLEETGFIKFAFMFQEQEFKIALML
jgi:hypothetical protein